MTRRNSLATIHEPFGDAYYFGPERMGSRFEEDEKAREDSGFSDSTFKTILDRIDQEGAEVCFDFAISLFTDTPIHPPKPNRFVGEFGVLGAR